MSSPIECAIWEGQTKAIRVLLEAGASTAGMLQWGIKHKCTKECIKLLLEYGADPNLINGDGSPLHALAICPNGMQTAEILALLLEHGADINVTFLRNNTPLHYAIIYINTIMVVALLDRGADVNKITNAKSSPLHLAIKTIPTYVPILLEAGADVTIRDSNCDTPLDIALMYGSTRVIEYLHKYGATC